MNIAILAPHIRLGGGNRILFTYANLLKDRGHNVVVYVRSTNRIRRTFANYLQIGKPDWMNLRCQLIRIPAWKDNFFGNHDHIIAGGFEEALAITSFPKEKGKGWYMIQHDEGMYHGSRELVDRALASSLGKIVVSTWLRDIVKERTGQLADLLINPVDRKQFFEFPKEKHDTINILFLDHTFQWKGTEEALSLVRGLQVQYPNVRCIGFGRRRPNVAELYDHFYFDPPQTKLREIYGEADIFLCPSWDEGFGLPSLEAMACGTAVVTYDNGGSRDFAFDGRTAFVAAHRDIKSLQKKLEFAITHPEERARVGRAGHEFSLSMPTWEDQVDALIKILDQSHA